MRKTRNSSPYNPRMIQHSPNKSPFKGETTYNNVSYKFDLGLPTGINASIKKKRRNDAKNTSHHSKLIFSIKKMSENLMRQLVFCKYNICIYFVNTVTIFICQFYNIIINPS